MTNRPPCDQCGHPLPDTAYVCASCAEDVGRALALVVKLAGEAEVTVARLERIARTGGRREPDPELAEVSGHTRLARTPWRATPPDGALVATQLPFAPWARRRYDAAVNDLTTTARHIAEQSGRDLPTVETVACHHWTCQSIRGGTRYLHGPACEDRRLHPVAAVAQWLAGRAQLEWLRYRPEGAEYLKATLAACRELESVVDRPVERVIVGHCACGEYLEARAGAATVLCMGCGTSYDVDASRERMREELADSLFTGAEIATLSTYLGYDGKREATRNRIKVWANRGLITAHGEYEGAPAYRFGEVMARLMATA